MTTEPKILSLISTVIQEEEEEEEEEEKDGLYDTTRKPLLSQTLKEVGSCGYEVAAIEVWLYDSGTGTLNRPYSSSSWWTNTKMMPQTDSLRIVIDPTHPSYGEPPPCPPGCDLAGILWSNTSTTAGRTKGGSNIFTSSKRVHYDDDFPKGCSVANSTTTHHYQLPTRQRTAEIQDSTSMGATVSFLVDTPQLQNPVFASVQQNYIDEVEEGKASPDSTMQDSINNASRKRSPSVLESIFRSALGRRPQNHSYFVPSIVYRDIHSILYNVDDAKSHRLLQLKNAGFTSAAGIRFTTTNQSYRLHYHDTELCGLVIYYFCCTSTTTTTHGLEYLMKHSYDLTTIEGKIAKANEQYLLQSTEYIGSTLAFIQSRTALCQYTMTSNTIAQQRSDGGKKSMTDTSTARVNNCRRILGGIQTWWYKCHGANLQIPPAFSWAEGKCF
jgi:hypothetical protein